MRAERSSAARWAVGAAAALACLLGGCGQDRTASTHASGTVVHRVTQSCRRWLTYNVALACDPARQPASMAAVKFDAHSRPRFVGAGVSSLGAPGLIAASGSPLRAGQHLRLTGAPAPCSDIVVVAYARDRLITAAFLAPAISSRGAVISIAANGTARLMRPGQSALSGREIMDLDASPPAPQLTARRVGSTVTLTVRGVHQRVPVAVDLDDRSRDDHRDMTIVVDGSRTVVFHDVTGSAVSARAIIVVGHGFTSPEVTVPIRG